MGLNFLYGKVLIINSGYYSDRLYSMTLHAMRKYKNIKKIVYVKLDEIDNVYGNFDWVYSCYTETSIGLKTSCRKN